MMSRVVALWHTTIKVSRQKILNDALGFCMISPQLRRQVHQGKRTYSSLPPMNTAALGIPESGIRDIMERAWQAEANDPEKRVIHLEVGQPNFESPPHAVDATAKAVYEAKNQRYISNAGIYELRVAIANMYTKRAPAVPTGTENIMVSHGCMFSMASALMTTVSPGDEVLVPDPGFPNYTQVVQMVGATPVYYRCPSSAQWQPDLSDIESRITPRTKLLMLCSPCNPSGVVIPPRVLESALEVAKKHNLYVLSDEVYGDINLDDPGVPCASALNVSPDLSLVDNGRLMVVSSVSKSYAMTAFRVGWLRASPEVIQIATKLQEPFVSCGVPFAQRGALAALTGPSEGITDMCVAYAKRRDIAVDILRAHGLHAYTPHGAFYILVHCGMDSTQFAYRLLDTASVAVAPGSAFGIEANEYVRISLASSDDDVREGVTRLCKCVLES
eukprot:m.613327 g.613327  ORF g.613327 m.613327 type:complete len:444 (+) comp22501_c0_seq12:213-1544(+)